VSGNSSSDGAAERIVVKTKRPLDRRPLEPVAHFSWVAAAAKALRNEILKRSDDDMFLGSESELVEWLGISQPTFRQAARLLEYEELLIVRRGVGGGFFGRRPSAEVVAKMAGIYLLSHGTTFADVIRAQHAMENEVLRDLGKNPNREVRARLYDFARNHPDLQPPFEVGRSFRAINACWQLAGELSGNKLFALFILTSQAYGARAGGFILTPERAAIFTRGLIETGAAIEAGDGEGAVAIRAAYSDQMLNWIRRDAASPVPSLAGDPT